MTIKQLLFFLLLSFIHGFSIADSLVFAVHPYLPALELQKRFAPLVEHLSTTQGHDVTLKISPSYEEHLNRIVQGDVDIAYLGPASFLKAYQKQPALETLAKLEVNGSPFFHGKIFTRANSEIRQLSDLSGKSFAFGNKHSTMSHLVPRYVLEQQGIMNKLSSFNFLDGHNNVAIGVLIGKYDAGAIKEGVFNKYENQGLRLIQNTEAIPEHLFISTHRVSSKICAEIKNSLLKITRHSNGLKIIKSIKPSVTNLVSAKPGDYNNLKQIMQKLNTLDY